MPKSRHSKRRSHRRLKMLGGDCGAAQHAINTYGGIGAQHAGEGNVIAVNAGSPPALVTGGGELTPALVTAGNKLQGGGIISDIGIPAAIVYTRDVIRKRRLPNLSMRRTRRRRRGSYRKRR